MTTRNTRPPPVLVRVLEMSEHITRSTLYRGGRQEEGGFGSLLLPDRRPAGGCHFQRGVSSTSSSVLMSLLNPSAFSTGNDILFKLQEGKYQIQWHVEINS